MPISGLVITFEHSFADQDGTISMLRSEPAIDVGEHSENKVAIVVDSATKDQDQKISQWVHNLPGVASVHIAFIGFDDDQSDHSSLASGTATGNSWTDDSRTDN